jgi:hypothetical protein
MSEETKAPILQDQIDKLERIINQFPLRIFVGGVLGGIAFGALHYFGYVGAVIGFAILGGGIGLYTAYSRQLKDEYGKLLEQLQKKSDIQE